MGVSVEPLALWSTQPGDSSLVLFFIIFVVTIAIVCAYILLARVGTSLPSRGSQRIKLGSSELLASTTTEEPGNSSDFCFISHMGDGRMGELKQFHRAKSGNLEGGVCLWAVLAIAGSSGLSKAKPMGVGKKGATGKAPYSTVS